MRAPCKLCLCVEVVIYYCTISYYVQEVYSVNCGYSLYNTLTNFNYDYAYKPGHVVWVIKNFYEGINELSIHAECNPGKEIHDEDRCVWTVDGIRYIPGETKHDHQIYWTGKNGCEWKEIQDSVIQTKMLIEGPNRVRNITCEMTLGSTQEKTRMTYTVITFDKSTTHGHPVTLSHDAIDYYTNLEDTIELQCQAQIIQGIYAISMKWYLEQGDLLIDVEDLDGLYTKDCTNRGIYRTSTLVVEKVSQELLNSTFKCIVGKIDLDPPFPTTTDPFQARPFQALTAGVDPVLTPENSRYIGNLTLSDYNITRDGCSLIEPCQSVMIVRLHKNPDAEESLALGLGLGLASAVIAILIGVALHCYNRRAVIINNLKHNWGITSDLEDNSFEYHAAILYSDKEIGGEEFVQNELLVKLENKWKYRVHLLQRDSSIGDSHADGRLHAINASQRCIFLLTDDIFTDDWMLYALYSSLKHHQKVVIIKKSKLQFQDFLGKFKSLCTSPIWTNYCVTVEVKKEGDWLLVRDQITSKLKGAAQPDRNEHSQTITNNLNPIESALRVAKIVDWNNVQDRWISLHNHLPSLIEKHTQNCCLTSVGRLHRYKNKGASPASQAANS